MSTEYTYPEDEYILVGRVSKAHGMRGEVKIYCYSEQPENIKQYRKVILVDSYAKLSPHLEIKKSRPQGKMAITLLETITDRNRAEHIEGMGVLIPKGDLPEIEQDEYYWHQLINKLVFDIEGNNLGTIKKIFSNGAQDIMVLKSGSDELLIPIVADIVHSTDNDRIIIDPPLGLLELNKPE